jgi:predicted solute-binding protein
VTISISIPESILTAYLRAGIANLPGGALTGNRSGFVIVETARIASLPDHAIHPDVGIVLRDRGVVALQSAVRPDELEQPTIWIRTSGPTAELLARATVAQYFGFRPRVWVDESGAADADVVIVDEAAAIGPIESGYREDLTRAWFVLTGLPFVSHLLAVPNGADPEQVAAITEWVGAGGGFDREQRRAVREEIAAVTGASLDSVVDLMTGIRGQLGLDQRRSVAELFARSGVADQIGPVRWYRDENEPG